MSISVADAGDVDHDGVHELAVGSYDMPSNAGSVRIYGFPHSNQPPQACINCDQNVSVNDVVILDGTCSSDPDGDPLGFSWELATKPIGSSAAITDPTQSVADFQPDLPGDYTVVLTVSDGLYTDQQSIQIHAVATADAAVEDLQQAVQTIAQLPVVSLKNVNLQTPLTQKIQAVIKMIDRGQYSDALDKLRTDILVKTDGCLLQGYPDRNDWIRTCEEQAIVATQVEKIIIIVEALMP